MNKQSLALLLRVRNSNLAIIAEDDTCIAHLTTGFAVERRLANDDLDVFAGSSGINRLAVPDDRLDYTFGLLGVVTEEFGSTVFFLQLEPDRFGRLVAGACPVRPGFRLLALHRIGKAGDIDADLAGAQCVLCQIEREAVGVVKFESGLAVEHVALVEIGRRIGKERKAALQRLAEAGFFQLQRFGRERLGTNQLRIGAAHFLDERRQELVHDRLLRTQKLGVTHGAAHDAAKDVTATFIRRQDTIGNQEG
ncbi:hypothetical protein D3C73_786670 [compost metagenome]